MKTSRATQHKVTPDRLTETATTAETPRTVKATTVAATGRGTQRPTAAPATVTKTDTAPVRRKTATRKLKPGSKQHRVELHRRLWTALRQTSVEKQIKALQRALRLVDWTITYKWDKPCNDDAVATITPMGDSRHARLQLSPEFLALTRDEQQQVLTHEMLHCHFFALVETANMGFEAVAGGKAATVFAVAIDRQHEMAVDALADAIAPMLPKLNLTPLTAAEKKQVAPEAK